MKKLLIKGLLAFMAFGAVSCGDNTEPEPDKTGSGVTNPTWSSAESSATSGATNSYSFTAGDSWTATSSQTWCEVLTPSGSAGAATLTIKTTANDTSSLRSATVTVTIKGYPTSSTIIITQDASSGFSGTGTYATLNKTIDNYLVERYLWNDEYNTMRRDGSISYSSSSSNFLYTTLMKMSTNVLDKKSNGQGGYKLYSYLIRTSGGGASAKTRGVNHGVAKKTETSFGFYNFYKVTFTGTSYYGLAPMAIYPGSPADLAGFKRGDMIAQFNGERITDANFNSVYSALMSPSSGQKVSLTKNETGAEPIAVTAATIYPNPVLKAKIFEEGGKKIGYIVYMGFDAAYDDDLLYAIKTIKDEGATELVLDLRYNGGGHVMSANMLSSCIAGAAAKGKIFHYYTYNPTRMAATAQTETQTGHPYDPSANKFSETFYSTYYSVDLQPYALNMTKIYILCTGNTASASEMTPYALKGIGIDVVFIGVTTNGKNVGMEGRTITDSGSSYEFAPITFQGYNAKQESVPSTGIVPNHSVAEWNNGLVDFGEKAEPLMAKALSLITGQSYATAVTRAGMASLSAEIMPEVPNRPHGMLVLSPEVE